MSFSLLAHQSAAATSGSSGATTAAIDTTGANLIVIAISYDGAATGITVSDNKSNTWTALTASPTGSPQARLYYCYNPTVGTGHTFSVAGTSGFDPIAVAAFSGSASSPVDQQNGAFIGSGVNNALAPGSVTPTVDNELCVTATGFNAAGTPFSINDSYTILEQIDMVGSTTYGLALGYRIETTATATNPTWTRGVGNFSEQAAVIATFKPATASGSVLLPPPMLAGGFFN